MYEVLHEQQVCTKSSEYCLIIHPEITIINFHFSYSNMSLIQVFASFDMQVRFPFRKKGAIICQHS